AGLAVIPHADDLNARVQGDVVSFYRPQGLALSAVTGADVEPIVQVTQNNEGPAFIDFAQWGSGPTEDVYNTERDLRSQLARLPQSESNRIRLQLARYLLAHSLATEALGIIQLIQAADPKFASDPSLAAMRGVAQYMMGRHGDARVSLSF